MRRIALAVAVGAAAILAARAFGPRLHERLMAACERMFEHMPDTFPPKRAIGDLDEVRANTARIVELLEATPEGTVNGERSEVGRVAG